MAYQATVRPARGLLTTSTTQGTYGGSTLGSASVQTPDLLGLSRGITSMPFDDPSIQRTFPFTNSYSLRGSSPQDIDSYLASDSNIVLSPPDGPGTSRNENYLSLPRDNSANTFAVPAIYRPESEPWNTLPLGPPSGTIGLQANRHSQRGRQSNLLPQYPPGPQSDAISRANGTDEGYYTNSNQDSQSVRSMSTRNVDGDQQNMNPHRLTPRSVPLAFPQAGPGQRPGNSEPAKIFTRRESTTIHPSVHSGPPTDAFECEIEDCGWTGKTQSEFKKHEARHKRKHVCELLDCPRKQGFATVNDLERHQKTVHKIEPSHGKSRNYKCFGSSCKQDKKKWPRFDNFKQHLKRMHPREDTDRLIQLSNRWYDSNMQRVTRQDDQRSERQQAQRSHAEASHTSSNPQYLHPGTSDWGRHRSGSQTKVVDNLHSNQAPLRSPSQTSLNDSQRSRSIGHPTQTMRGSSSGEGQLSYSIPPSQTSRRAPTLFITNQSYGQSGTRGSQNVSTPSQMNMFSQMTASALHRNQGHWQHQSGVQRYVPMQKSTSNTVGAQSQYQLQTEHMSLGCGPKTAPEPSVPHLQTRLQDFNNSPISQAQFEFSMETSYDLQQIATNPTIGNARAGIPYSTTDTQKEQSQGQAEDDEIQQAVQAQLSTDSIRSFLKPYLSQNANGSVDTVIERIIQAGVLSLQSSPSNTDSSNSSRAQSAVDLTQIKRDTRDGKTVYLCPDPNCKKYMARQCNLRKHIKRHQRPYGCTFDKCEKSFGSKNDWKRHETTQHEQQECWRCEEKQTSRSGRRSRGYGEEACRSVYYKREIYIKHLRARHGFTDAKLVGEMSVEQRIGPKCQSSWWCGFCNKIMVTREKGIACAEYRFEHIDDHFKKGLKIGQWQPLEGRPSQRNILAEDDSSSACDESSEDNNEEEIVDGTGTNIPQSEFMGAVQKPRKRSAPENELAESRKLARSMGQPDSNKRTVMIQCCSCENVFQNWNSGCPDCPHRVCRECKNYKA